MKFDPRGLVLPIFLVVTWAFVAGRGLANPHLLIPPAYVATALVGALVSHDYWVAVGTSLGRLFAGFGIGAFAGIVVGLLLGTTGTLRRIGGPTLTAARQVALFAWIPLLTAWFGEGDFTMTVLVALAAFFPTALNTEIGCRNAPRELLEVGEVLEFDRWRRLQYIILPSAVRSIAVGLQVALTAAWIGTIGAEYLIDQGSGIGIALSAARLDDRMDLLIVYMLTLGLVGLGLNTAVRVTLARSSA